MFFFYMLLRGIPTETSDPDTKERYGLPLVLHILGEVVKTVLEMLMAVIVIDIVAGGIFPADAKDCLAEYLVNFLMIVIPSICCLISALLYGGILIER
mmetsp:Transcript_56500/g.120004  ORF Transcript_56500/g.120004 Transcript_56500/m.120004 type:complete len:98 (+) Transcript_56500:477-770(+)